MGTVYWITGLSGAGKTTVGKLLYERIKTEHPNTLFLDGDTLRSVFGNDLGYTGEDRRKCAMRYSRLCAMLEQQDMYVICCTISMFDSVRDWNRAHINNYREIYVKASMETLRMRNQKGLYGGSAQTENGEVVGLHMDYEEPKHPDLILKNDGEKTPQQQVEEIYRSGMAD